MKVMFVHGVGFHETPSSLLTWSDAWSKAIQKSCADAGVKLDFPNPLGTDRVPGGGDDMGILYYEDIIKQHRSPDTGDYLATVSSLLWSYAYTKVTGLFSRNRSLLGIDDELQWKAREVAAWVHNDAMRIALREKVIEEIRAKDPDVVIAHSYGGLITYDACLFGDANLLKDRYYVTLGTQIGNPLLRREFVGRQLPVKAAHWFNLYNPGDRVFVSPLDHIQAPNFTHLVIDHPNGHDGASYLGHAETANRVWRRISQSDILTRGTGPRTRSLSMSGLGFTSASAGVRSLPVTRQPVNRALLVGVDTCAHPAVPPLHGCVNDTYLMSAALQESGLDHRAIRMLHNERATLQNLLDGLAWLLEDAQPGDQRIFSCSSHGYRQPAYNPAGVPDHMEEILVTYDFDFTPGSGLRDRDFQDLYADLPKGVHFMIFLDMCHAAGTVRAGGPLTRSFAGPGDVEHPCRKWDPELQMWHQVGLLPEAERLDRNFLPKDRYSEDEAAHLKSLYFGSYGDVRRIGRASQLRDLPHDRYDRLKAKLDELHPDLDSDGPYLPLVFMACQEHEQAAEYIHGSVSYGAFTFATVQALRDTLTRSRSASVTFEGLLKNAHDKLIRLGYTQTPDILAATVQRKTVVNFASGALSSLTAEALPARKAPAKKKAVAKKAAVKKGAAAPRKP